MAAPPEPAPAQQPLRADDLAAVLQAEGVSHAVGLPDSVSAPLLDRLTAHGVRFVQVTREGEAFAVASGLWLGGATPVVVIQNTGLLESGDALRGTASRMGVPLVMLVTYRGHAKLQASGLDPGSLPRPRDVLVRADVDTVALFTEPTLAAWGVPFETLTPDDGARQLAGAFRSAREAERPVAVLLARRPA